MKYFTSDTHFGHANVIKYSNRPFTSVEEMNEKLIENWNDTVHPNDEIYHLGDFGFMPEAKIDKILQRLNRRKYLVFGNHDKAIRKSKLLREHFVYSSDKMEVYLKSGGLDTTSFFTVLDHYAHLVWNKSHHGSFQLHGHSHGQLKYPNPMKALDVGVDPMKMFPISEVQVISKLNSIPISGAQLHHE